MIKEKRKLKNYTQEQMANMLNISLRHYVRIDQERSFPRSDILNNLINLLDLSNEEIGLYIKSVIKVKSS